MGALPSLSARRRTSWARPSISRKRTPGTSLRTACLAAPRLPPHDVAVPGLVLVDREQPVDDRGDRRHRDRHHDPLEDAVDLRPGQDVDREGHEQPVQHQRRAAQREDGQRQREAGEDRPDQRVEEADQRRRAKRGRRAVQDEARQHLREQQQRERVEQEDEQAPPDGAEAHGLGEDPKLWQPYGHEGSRGRPSARRVERDPLVLRRLPGTIGSGVRTYSEAERGASPAPTGMLGAPLRQRWKAKRKRLRRPRMAHRSASIPAPQRSFWGALISVGNLRTASRSRPRLGEGRVSCGR